MNDGWLMWACWPFIAVALVYGWARFYVWQVARAARQPAPPAPPAPCVICGSAAVKIVQADGSVVTRPACGCVEAAELDARLDAIALEFQRGRP